MGYVTALGSPAAADSIHVKGHHLKQISMSSKSSFGLVVNKLAIQMQLYVSKNTLIAKYFLFFDQLSYVVSL